MEANYKNWVQIDEAAMTGFKQKRTFRNYGIDHESEPFTAL